MKLNHTTFETKLWRLGILMTHFLCYSKKGIEIRLFNVYFRQYPTDISTLQFGCFDTLITSTVFNMNMHINDLF